MTFQNKHKKLLKIDQVKRWHENMKARSPISADVWLRNLGFYCELNHTTPQGVIENARNGELKNQFMDFVRSMESREKAGSYIVKFKHTLRSWLSFNEIDYPLKVNIANEDENPTTMNERVPTKDELARVIRESSRRGRVSISLMAFAGLRPESLGNYEGNDGLLLGDIREMRITDQGVEFDKIPAMVVVRKRLSKARIQYFSFMGAEGVNYITEYLDERIKSGEKLTPESPLLKIDRTKYGSKRDFLRTLLVTRDIREGITKAGLRMRPYVLRAYFSTALDIAESKGLISHPWRQFMMGHKGDIESRYSTNKGRLPPEMVEEMRESYRKCLPFIETESKGINEEDMQRKFKEQILLMDGFTKEEIEKEGLLDLEDEELRNRRREKLFGSRDPRTNSIDTARKDKIAMQKLKNGARQRIVPSYAIEAYLNEGFEFVSTIPGDKAIVRLS